ncbi:helix-turn-helix domain-containing protein [Leptospira sp. WS92.C1]
MKKIEFDLDTPGGRLRFVRFKANEKKILSQEEFGDSIYLSQSALSKMENNESDIMDQTLTLIEFIYGFRKEWIASKIGPEKIDARKELELAKLKLEGIDERNKRIEKLQGSSKTIDIYLNLPKRERTFIDNYVLRILKKREGN